MLALWVIRIHPRHVRQVARGGVDRKLRRSQRRLSLELADFRERVAVVVAPGPAGPFQGDGQRGQIERRASRSGPVPAPGVVDNRRIARDQHEVVRR